MLCLGRRRHLPRWRRDRGHR